VLNATLEGKEYLVGNKCTAADLAFMTWGAMVPMLLGDSFPSVKFAVTHPNSHAWIRRMMARESVQKVFADKKKAMGES
jgi:glutathione S-transferase